MTRHRMLLLLAALLLAFALPAVAQAGGEGRFTGEIDAFSETFMVVAGIVFSLASAEIAPETVLESGAAVSVNYTLARGAFAATRIAPPQTTARGVGRLRGTVERSDGDTVTIAGAVFDAGRITADDAAFKPGTSVAVDYAASGGSFVALRLAVHDPRAGTAAGAVQALDDDTLTVNGITFRLGGAQLAETGNALEAGALVKVEFVTDDDGTLRATFVDVRAAAPETPLRNRALLAGTVDNITGNSITIAGITVDTAGARVDDTVRAGEFARVMFRGSTLAPSRVRSLDDIDDIDFIIDRTFSGDDDDNDTPAVSVQRATPRPTVNTATQSGDDDDDGGGDDDGDDD